MTTSHPTPNDALAMQWETAADLGPSAWRGGLARAAAAVTARPDLDVVRDPRLAPPVAALLEAAVQTSQPGTWTLRAAERARRSEEDDRALRRTLIYPLVIAIAALSLAVYLHWTYSRVNELLAQDAPAQIKRATESVMRDTRLALQQLIGIAVWLAALLGLCRWWAPPSLACELYARLPCLGRPYRWSVLSDMLHRLRGALGQGQPLDQAARIVVTSYQHTGLAPIADELRTGLASGQGLGTALARWRWSDDQCRPLLMTLDEDDRSLEDRLRAVLDGLDAMRAQRHRLLLQALPWAAILISGTMVWVAVDGYLSIIRASRDVWVSAINPLIGPRAAAPAEAISSQAHWLNLIPIAITLWIALRISLVVTKSREEGWVYGTLRLSILLMLWLGFMGIGARSSIMSSLWSFFGMAVLLILWRKNRELKRSMLLACFLPRLNQPSAFASLARRMMLMRDRFIAARGRRLIAAMAAGRAPAEALQRARIAKRSAARWAVRLIDRYGPSTPLVDLAMGRQRWSPAIDRAISGLTSGWASLALGPPLALGIAMFVGPTMSRMGREFSSTAESDSSILDRLTGFESPWLWLAFVVLGGLAWLPITLYVFPGLLDRPLIGRWTQGWARSWTLRGLSESIARGGASPAHFHELAAIHPLGRGSRWLEQTGQRLAGGQSLGAALHRGGLIRAADASLVDTAADTKSVAWVLSHLADQQSFRSLQRLRWLSQGVLLALVLLQGCLAWILCYSFIAWYTHLIQNLAH